ncbi:spore coat protein [Peribacillus sp. SCS-155]|uniref:spore coat protein n=1 Tax=Peribacillus sedimenti TaxID=3115297 RepID=UPI003905B28A
MDQREHRLAWHETLEIHELVAFQSTGLIKLKKHIHKITDPELRSLHAMAIQALEKNIQELVQFYPAAPMYREVEARADNSFYASDLLGLAKMTVRNYATAVTEAATPQVRTVLSRHLQTAIQLHGQAFYYTYKRGLYPAYDLPRLLENDVLLAQKALRMDY